MVGDDNAGRLELSPNPDARFAARSFDARQPGAYRSAS